MLTFYSEGSVRTACAAHYPLQGAPSSLELFPQKVRRRATKCPHSPVAVGAPQWNRLMAWWAAQAAFRANGCGAMFLVHDHPSHNSTDHLDGTDMVDIGLTVLDDIGVITVIGELDVSNSAMLHRYLQNAMDTGLKEIVVDIEHLSYLDSSGLAVLWKAHTRMDSLGGHLVVFGPTPSVVRLLDVTGMGWLLNVRSAAE